MFDSHQFFKTRFSSHIKETSRYLRYIFNGHIAVAMFFFISALAYYYQQWLVQMPANFPTAIIMAVVFGGLASHSPVRTLLKDPDLVFLLPAEYKLRPYFRNTLIYSFVIQLYVILLAAAVFGPLYFASFPAQTGGTYLLIIVVLLIFKLWNLLANWWMLKTRDPRSRATEQFVRLLLNVVSFYFFINGEWLFAAATTVLLVGLILYDFSLSKRQAGIVWDLLVQKDQARMHTFYRIANMFTDVPHLRNQIKKRHWLVSLLTKGVSFKQDKTFDYLYRITMVRSGDYLGLYLRLLVIGGLAIYFVPNMWVKLAFSLLFIYLSGFQMMTLWQHHRTVVWLDLYPVHKKRRQQALTKWLLELMVVNTFLFGLLFLFMGNFLGLLIVWIGGSIFSYLFINGYVKNQLT